ncbi:AraC family transcriptional regulator ligand-binding domain-containing protein [Pseudoalteromonas sp. SSDWG2]|uniref:AraC family transcriptional regulator n=1 Tax=Pseudoalteromonas sp. SSDWG2 TaxID=3139391 RepID=UPI003BABFCFA
MHTAYVSYQVLRSLVLFLQSKGLSRSACLEKLNCTEHELNSLDSRFTISDYNTLMRWAHQQLQCPHIGLLFGAHIDLERWGVLGHLASVSPDLRQVIEYGRRFHSLVRHTQSLSVHQHVKTLTIDLGPTPHECYYVIDELFASWLQFANTYALDAGELAPQHVYLTRAAPQTPKEKRLYESILNCDVTFGASTNALVMPREAINLRLKHPDKALEQLLEHQAQQQLASHKSLCEAVKLYISAFLPNVPKTAQIAQLCGFSPRSLQRQLALQHTSYTQLLDESRKQLALQLFESDYSAVEVSNKLGFSEQSALQRAFKRWFGVSPKKYLLQQRELEKQ